MTLQIKGAKNTANVIELVQSSSEVTVKINGTIIASFYDNGEFEFYGQKSQAEYSGVWDK